MINTTKDEENSLLATMFLVAGTCIGGGMLVLPTATGILGFLPTVVIMAISWGFMAFTGLLLLEVSLWMEEGEHIISMASRFLGPVGRWISWGLYLFICYGSVVAYAAGGGEQIAVTLSEFVGHAISSSQGAVLFVMAFGLLIYFGKHFVGSINALLFVAMIAAYFCLIAMGASEIEPSFLIKQQKWNSAFYAIPLLLTSFSFQTLVPSLTPMLHRHTPSLRWAIIGGTGIVFIVYFVWEALTLGVIPVEGQQGLRTAMEAGEPVTYALRAAVKSPWLSRVAEYFAFFAIVTSFLGITIGLFDFLADGLKIAKVGRGKIFLSLIIALPTLFFATTCERIFSAALEATGGFGDSILNGLIPVIMVWVGRYKMNLKAPYRVMGGKTLLALAFAFYLIIVFFELFLQLGLISPLNEFSRTLDF